MSTRTVPPSSPSPGTLKTNRGQWKQKPPGEGRRILSRLDGGVFLSLMLGTGFP